MTRLTPLDSPVYALGRESSEGMDRVLVLVNTDIKRSQRVSLDAKRYHQLGEPSVDLLAQAHAPTVQRLQDEVIFTLPAGAAYCLARTASPAGLAGDAYCRLAPGRRLDCRLSAGSCQSKKLAGSPGADCPTG
ncbi:MAG: hypothetical protein U1G07_27790 [Verrucomicrobiota bacterium]